jgi:hypothetical protein
MNQAEQLDPGNPQCHLSLGELDARQRDSARLDLSLRMLCNSIGTSPPPYYTLAGVYHHLGLNAEPERAYASFQQEKSTASEGQSDRVGSAIKSQRNSATIR